MKKEISAAFLREIGFVVDESIRDEAVIDVSTIRFEHTGGGEEAGAKLVEDFEVAVVRAGPAAVTARDHFNFHFESWITEPEDDPVTEAKKQAIRDAANRVCLAFEHLRQAYLASSKLNRDHAARVKWFINETRRLAADAIVKLL